jgi:hypothetical protein
MEMRIKPHSLVDVITNSSTIVYITMRENAIDDMYAIIDEVLKVAESDKNARDLFNVEKEYDWFAILDYFIDDVGDNEKESGLVKIYESLNRDDQKKFEKEELIPYLKESGRFKDYLQDSEGVERDNWLVVKAKDESKSTKEIWNMIRNLFDADAIFS